MHCVDVFRRSDGSYGFASFRRDPEALTGWFPTGAGGTARFETESGATQAAREELPWLDDVLKQDGRA